MAGPATASLLVLLLCSCSTGGGGSGSSGGGNSPAAQVTGNWEFQATPSHGAAPFTAFAGYLHESGSGNSQFLTAAVQAQSGGCYNNLADISLTGSVAGSQLLLSSIPVDSQVLSLDMKANQASDQVTGSYSIKGGCASGDSGTITGQKYAIVNGTYTGALLNDSSRTMSLTLSQNQHGTGDGGYQTSGNASFTGDNCFSQGSLSPANGTIIGSAVSLTFTTNDPGGAQIAMTGTVNTAADTLTLTSIEVRNGSCPGTLGPATLHLQ
jgi:hypothetical protein